MDMVPENLGVHNSGKCHLITRIVPQCRKAAMVGVVFTRGINKDGGSPVQDKSIAIYIEVRNLLPYNHEKLSNTEHNTILY